MPWVLMASILGFEGVAVTQVALRGRGLGRRRAVARRTAASSGTSCRGRGARPDERRSSPDPSQTPTHPGLGHGCVSRGVTRRSRLRHGSRAAAAGVLRRRAVPLEDVPVDLEYETPFLERCARALRGPARRGRHLRRARRARRRARRGARGRAASAPATGSALFVPCHRVVAAGGLGSYGSLGVGYKRRLLELEGYAAAV